MMVDSGMGVVSLRQWVPLVSERPLDAVASHTHFDHVGCHHEFPCRLCHEAEAEILTNPTQINTLAADYVTDEIFDVLPPPPYQSATYGVEAAPVTRILEDGDIVDLGDRHFEVIHTPGHSPGGIALWDPTAQLLIAGDIVYDGPLVETGGLTEQTQYIASMKRLLNLPAQTVLGGHFAPYGTRRHQKNYYRLATQQRCMRHIHAEPRQCGAPRRPSHAFCHGSTSPLPPEKHRSQASITSSRDLTDNIHLAGLGAAGCQCFLPLHLTGLLFLFYFDQRLQLP